MRLSSHIARLDHFPPPAFLCEQIFIERETSGNEAEIGAVLLRTVTEMALSQLFLCVNRRPYPVWFSCQRSRIV